MIPADVLRALAVEWRREADILAARPDGFVGFQRAAAYRLHATELDDLADHYERAAV